MGRTGRYSGATSGSNVAEFLRGDGPVKTAAERKLERLAAPATQPEVESDSEKAPEPKVDEKKLAALAETNPTPEASKPADKEKAPDKKADLTKANKKLSGLLGEDNKD